MNEWIEQFKRQTGGAAVIGSECAIGELMTKIGIVDGNKAAREELASVIDISPGNHCICLCGTAEQALALLPAYEPEVVLMEIQLPGMSGIECMARLKKLLPDVEVIVVTENADPDHIFSALRGGASGYLLKRSAHEQIVAAIRDVQSGGAPMSSEIARKVILHLQEQTTLTEGLEKLTRREREVMELLAEGSLNKEIADRLGVSVDTVRCHLKRIYPKLKVRTRTEAALRLRRSK